MTKAILLDDEQNCIDVLLYELNRLEEEVQVVATFTDPQEALEQIKDIDHDILFLDIEMPRMNAFQFLDEVGQLPSNVIFTTAYDHYALKAFRYYAMDYLLKPISHEELSEAIQRSRQQNIGVEKQLINEIYSKIKAPNTVFSRIAVPVDQGLQMIDIEAIVFCKADSNYASIMLSDGTRIVISKTLKYLESLLKNHGFYRIHQSSLININYLDSYKRTDGGTVTMKGGYTLPVSRANKKSFGTFLSTYGR